MLYKARKEAINFFDNYSSMTSEAKNKAAKGTGLKIFTPKQMLQRLAIALTQVKQAVTQKIIKRNQANCLLFVSIKRNYQKSIQ